MVLYSCHIEVQLTYHKINLLKLLLSKFYFFLILLPTSIPEHSDHLKRETPYLVGATFYSAVLSNTAQATAGLLLDYAYLFCGFFL